MAGPLSSLCEVSHTRPMPGIVAALRPSGRGGVTIFTNRRPSLGFHSYILANLRLVLAVDVRAGMPIRPNTPADLPQCAPLARKLLSRGASLVCETICGTPSRQQALVLSPSRHRPCLTRCAALRCVGNNPRIHCLQPLNSCLPSAGCRTVPLAVNWRPADQTAGTTGSPSTADSIATIRSCQRRAKTGLVRRSKY